MLKLLVPAKLNLDLRVGRARADGFHPLSSWFVTVGLFDELTFEPYPLPGVYLTCSDPSLAVDGRNLVIRAAHELLLSLPEDDPARLQGIAISLTKRIPTGGGLGGGSADAAYTLLGLTRMLDLLCTSGQLQTIAARLGSDVAFFLKGPSALCTGRGELVDALPAPSSARAALLVLPGVHMPTPAVYREFDKLNLGRDLEPRHAAITRWMDGAGMRADALLGLLENDLETPAFAISAELSALRAALQRRLGRPVRMSGSGSTLFTLYDRLEDATRMAEILEHEGLAREGGALAVEVCPRVNH